MSDEEEGYDSKNVDRNADTLKTGHQQQQQERPMASLEDLFVSSPPPLIDTNTNDKSMPTRPPQSPAFQPRRPGYVKQRTLSSSGGTFPPLEVETKAHLRKISGIPIEALNPHESEAEAHILNAIERQSSSRRDVQIFRHVPESAVDDFSAEFASISGNKQSSSHHEDNNDINEGTSLQSLSRHTSATTSKGGDPAVHQQDETASPKPPLVKQASRRKLTLEESLTDVAYLMNQVHRQDEQHLQAVVEEEDAAPNETFRASDETPLFGSAEAFAQNAIKLSSSSPKNNAASSGESTTQESDSETAKNHHSTTTTTTNHHQQQRKKRRRKKKNTHRKLSFTEWQQYFYLRRDVAVRYVYWIVLYILTPALAVSALVFYVFDNPMSKTGASISWWILFLGMRQVITLSFAVATQAIIIDYLALGTRILMRILGPVLTLCIVQSKGWPFCVFWWCMYDFALLYDSRWGRHWCFWQNVVKLFNEENPAGGVIESEGYRRTLLIAVSVSLVVMVKRFVIGLFLGRQTFLHYGEQLTAVLNKMLLVSEVARLAKDIAAMSGNEEEDQSLHGLAFADGYFNGSARDVEASLDEQTSAERVIDPNHRDALTGSLHDSQRMKLYQLLDQWEEPTRDRNHGHTQASISAVLNFRKALAFIQKTYPFSFAFGPAQTREECVESAQRVYESLLKRTPDQPTVQFETIALLALEETHGTIDQTKAKALLKAFRPDRHGNLTMLDFVRSVDTIYREYRFLSAGIANAGVLDHQIENVFNWIFYALIVVVVMSQLGFDPLAFFLSISSVIVAFAFMIGNSASKFVDGIFFIVGRRPYSIGDLVFFSDPQSPMGFDGQPPFVVKNISLWETTAIWCPTNEHCSYSNGSLATTRVVNLAQSPNPQFFIKLKLPINTPYDKILILKGAVEEFMKARPREWLSLNGFRAERVDASKGWIEYVVVAMGRSTWQEIGQVLDSKANLSSYCQEVCKQLGIHYTAPPLPVDLTTYERKKASTHGEESANVMLHRDNESRAVGFRQLAHAHNIKLN